MSDTNDLSAIDLSSDGPDPGEPPSRLPHLPVVIAAILGLALVAGAALATVRAHADLDDANHGRRSATEARDRAAVDGPISQATLARARAALADLPLELAAKQGEAANLLAQARAAVPVSSDLADLAHDLALNFERGNIDAYNSDRTRYDVLVNRMIETWSGVSIALGDFNR